MFALKINELDKFFNEVNKDIDVYLPIKQNNTVDFRHFENNCQIDLQTLKTNKSPKNLFFCAYERLTDIKREGKSFSVTEIEKNDKKFVIFGVRPCDYKSFEILDNVFMAEPCDEFYKSRRENALIIVMACSTFDSDCFCTNFGIKPYFPDGDIVCYQYEDNIIFEGKSEKGIQFMNKYANLFINIDFNTNAYSDELKNKFENLPLKNLNLEIFKTKNMMDIFNDGRWEEMSNTCLGCGSCTFFCPTCQCYDLGDFKCDDKITRYRCWDSCMYSDFTLVAGGGNPRKTQKERFRQRFMHKLVYYPLNYNGTFSCVGCGRCLKVCPNHLNIVKVIKKLGE